jgi:hypothetical protein
MLATGCACKHSIRFQNESPHSVHVELALPWPSYSIPKAGGCHFSTTLKPGMEWISSRAEREERVSLDMRMANGTTVFRLREGLQTWQEFQVDSRDDVSITIHRASDGGFEVSALGESGDEVGVMPSSLNWFRD